MKTKIIVVIIGALIMLSFTFSSISDVKQPKSKISENKTAGPIGGIVSDEVIR